MLRASGSFHHSAEQEGALLRDHEKRSGIALSTFFILAGKFSAEPLETELP
jgi:hypothetical protein